MSRRTDPVVDADEAGGAGTLSLLEERRGRREELESRVRGVEEKVSQYVEVAAERGSSLRDDVKQLEEGLGTCRVKREVLAERKRKELDLVEGNIAGALGEERETRKESHRQLVRFVEEKAQVLKAGLVTARTAREETGDHGIHQVRQEISRLADRVDQELVKVAQQEANVSRKLVDESVRLESLIQNEREKRERMQNSMLQILEDLSVRHQLAIKTEKREREATEELLLKVRPQNYRLASGGVSSLTRPPNPLLRTLSPTGPGELVEHNREGILSTHRFQLGSNHTQYKTHTHTHTHTHTYVAAQSFQRWAAGGGCFWVLFFRRTLVRGFWVGLASSSAPSASAALFAIGNAITVLSRFSA